MTTTLQSDYTVTTTLAPPLPRRNTPKDPTALADQLEKIVVNAESAMNTIFLESCWPDFLMSDEYLNYTKTPEGSRAAKHIKSKLGKKEKTSHQEFRLEHLKVLETRKKYGKKFLGEMLQAGRIDHSQYETLLEATKTLPQHQDGNNRDPLEEILKNYYLVPLVREKTTKLENSYVVAPQSGFAIFEAFLRSRGEGPLAYFLELSQKIRFIRDTDGNIAALKFFKEDYFVFSGTPERLELFVRTVPSANRRTISLYLKNNVTTPFQRFYKEVERMDFDQQASTKSIELGGRVKEEEFWC